MTLDRLALYAAPLFLAIIAYFLRGVLTGIEKIDETLADVLVVQGRHDERIKALEKDD